MSPALPKPGTPGAPRYWRDETSGRLEAAIRAYLDNPLSMNMRDIALMRVYLRQWIDAPVWRGEEIDELRAMVDTIQSGADIARWLEAADAVQIDPL